MMRCMHGYWFAGIAVFLLWSPADASCRDDLDALKPRIERMKNTNKDRYGLASKWYNKAVEADETSDEAGCYNDYIRASRALTQPLPQVGGCVGPNAYLPQCNAPGNRGAANGGVPAPVLGGAMGGGGGGAAVGGGGAAARGPVTAQPPAPFNPPGSIAGSGGSSI